MKISVSYEPEELKIKEHLSIQIDIEEPHLLLWSGEGHTKITLFLDKEEDVVKLKAELESILQDIDICRKGL